MTFTLRVAINGSETDDSVYDDDEPWDCKLGSIATTEGGGGWTKEAANAVCTFTANVSSELAPLVHQITIAIQGPFLGTPEPYWHDNGDGTYYRIIFHGNIIASRSVGIQAGSTEFQAISEMQGLFERAAHCGGDSNVGARDLTNQIETNHSITVANGNPMIPTAADFYNTDRPKQHAASNGDFLRTAMAGTGMSIVGEWEGTLASPDLAWRTDFPWTHGDNYNFAVAAMPWLFEYADIGVAWRDFPAEVEVNGEQGNTLAHAGWVRYSSLKHLAPREPTRIIDVSNGTRYWGRASLTAGAMRRNCGNVTYSVQSWIDTAAECEDAAAWIIKHTGEPTYNMMNALGFWPDRLFDEAVKDANFTEDEEDYAMEFAVLTLGDWIDVRPSFATTTTWGHWPTTCPVGSAAYLEIYALWHTAITNDTHTSSVATEYVVRTIAREWTPAAGWHIQVGLEPNTTVTLDTLDHGTYT